MLHPIITKITEAIENSTLGIAEGHDPHAAPSRVVSKDERPAPTITIMRRGDGKSKRAKRNDPIVMGHMPTRLGTWRDVERLRRSYGKPEDLRRKTIYVDKTRLSALTREQLDLLAELYWSPRDPLSIVDRIAKLG